MRNFFKIELYGYVKRQITVNDIIYYVLHPNVNLDKEYVSLEAFMRNLNNHF